MTLRQALLRVGGGILFLSALYAIQRPFRTYPSMEAYDNIPLPDDAFEKTEWVFGRLMYPQHPQALFGGSRRFAGALDWREGRTSWTQDYPRADRHFSAALRRLTRVHARSAEQPVNLDDGDDVFHWPWLYAVQVGEWQLTAAQVAKLREYLLRGGFFMCDDFWGADQWEMFQQSMQRVFPDRAMVDLPGDDPIFHTIFDLNDRYQVPGARSIGSGQTAKCYGCEAAWRGIYDDTGRLMVAATFDSDLGDSWEFADDPRYPEKYSALGLRIGVNYVVYAMTR